MKLSKIVLEVKTKRIILGESCLDTIYAKNAHHRFANSQLVLVVFAAHRKKRILKNLK